MCDKIYVYRVYYNLDWYTYCLFKGRHPETLEDLELSGGSTLRTWPHMSHFAKLPQSKEARDNSLRRLPSSLDIFLIFSSSLQCFSISHCRWPSYLVRFFTIFLFRCMLDCAEVCTTACNICQFAAERYKDKAVMQLNKECRFRTAPQNPRRSPGIFQGKDSCSVSEKNKCQCIHFFCR